MCVQNISCIIQTFARPKLSLIWVFPFRNGEVTHVSSDLWKCWSQLQLVLSVLLFLPQQGQGLCDTSCCCSAPAPIFRVWPQSWKLCLPSRELKVQGTCPGPGNLPCSEPLAPAWLCSWAGLKKREEKMLRCFLFECCNAGLTFILLFHLGGNWTWGVALSCSPVLGVCLCSYSCFLWLSGCVEVTVPVSRGCSCDVAELSPGLGWDPPGCHGWCWHRLSGVKAMHTDRRDRNLSPALTAE